MYYIRISGDCQRQDSIKRGEKPHRLSAIRLLQQCLQHAEGGELPAQRRLQVIADFGQRQAHLASAKAEQL